MPLDSDLLTQLIDRIREEGSYVLASEEDADFYRAVFQKKPIQAPPPTSLPTPTVPLPEKPIQQSAPPKESPKTDQEPVRAPLEKKKPLDFSSLRNILSVVAPEFPIQNEIPKDIHAVKISQRWKTKNQSAPISILVYQEPPEQKELLLSIAKAIDIYFGPAKIVQSENIEQDKQWGAFLSSSNLKLIIVCDYTLWQLNALMEHYKEVPAQQTRELGKIPLFLLPDLSLYLKDPLLKRSLWNALRQKCQHL